jgi:23S rRNA (adenine1618-N6)-methyltransferase
MINEAIDTIIGTISSLDIRWRWNATDRVGTGEAFANVWNRAYRREQMRKQKSGGLSKGMDEDEKPVALAFRIHVAEQPTKEVVLDWLRGTDVQLWESFYGMMHRHFKNPTDKPKKTKEPTGITEERPSSSGKGFSRF